MTDRTEFLTKYFPDVKPGRRAAGRKIIVQTPTVPEKSTGGIIRIQAAVDDMEAMTAWGVVVDKGPDAYRPDCQVGDFGEDWCAIGDIVQIPRYGDSVRFKVDNAAFMILDDIRVISIIDDVDTLPSV